LHKYAANNTEEEKRNSYTTETVEMLLNYDYICDVDWCFLCGYD